MPIHQTFQLVAVDPPRPSLLQRMRAAVRSFTVPPISVRDPALAKFFGDGYRSTAGIVVNEENALTCSAVLNAVMQISNDVAKLPLNLRKRTQDGGSEDYVDSKLYNLLKLEPNPEMGSMEFRRTLTAHALTCHGGYAEIERDGLGRPVAIWPLTPDRVRPVRKKIEKLGKYELGPLKYEIDGGDTVLDASDVVHIHGLGYDGYVGYQIINKARQAIGLALAAERFGGSFFGNGTTFGGIFSTEMDLDEETVNAQRELIEKYHQSSEKAWKNLFLLGGWKYQGGAGVDPQKSQMVETRDKQIEEVARFFRMPPYRLGLNKPGTVSYASVELANLDYYTGALLDWLTTWEQELNRKLIPRLERRQQYIKHNANAFLRADIKTRYDAYAVLLDRGVFNADDVLELEDMSPQSDGLGKIYLVQGAQVPKDKIQAIADSQIARGNR